jgi:hypothetical protein
MPRVWGRDQGPVPVGGAEEGEHLRAEGGDQDGLDGVHPVLGLVEDY